jgi:hypothetical protein
MNLRSTIFPLLIAAPLLIPSADASPIYETSATRPVDCVESGTLTEFGGPILDCPDGSHWYQDMDGQPYANDAGYPVYEVGTWFRLRNVS